MKRVSLPTCINLHDFNTTNHHDRDPYYIEEDSNNLIIDTDWWNTQVPQRTKDLLKEREIVFVLGNVPIPHDEMFGFGDERLIHVYQAYQEAFEYQEWAKGGVIMCITIAQKRAKDWVGITQRMDFFLGGSDKKLFVRTGSTSGKNTVPIKPCYNAKEVVEHLSNNPEILMREWERYDKDTYICFQEWEDRITSRNEFRLFIFNQRLVALSPQKYGQCHDYSQEELDIIEEAVLSRDYDAYTSYIVDAWVDFETRKLHVIEYNCFGDHSGAGSSLFNWVEDHDILYGQKDETEFRFISVVDLSS